MNIKRYCQSDSFWVALNKSTLREEHTAGSLQMLTTAHSWNRVLQQLEPRFYRIGLEDLGIFAMMTQLVFSTTFGSAFGLRNIPVPSGDKLLLL